MLFRSAVTEFQAANDLVADGEAGHDTVQAIGLKYVLGPKPAS
ncbi:MAG: peptidoglycan-binding domain-containing protein [Myxococcota bacterium]